MLDDTRLQDNILIILSKKAREKFEDNYEIFSEKVQEIYNAGENYHGGRLLFADNESAEEIFKYNERIFSVGI